MVDVVMTARARLESLLKARKLDVTLTSATPWPVRPSHEDRAAVGAPSIDVALGGGLRRGHVSEIVGARSSGRTTVMCRALGEAVSRGELVALVDTCDRFDPESAAASGLNLSRLLWIRDTGDPARALKAMNLVLQAGGFGLVVFDLADVPAGAVRALPFTTWFRLARVIEGTPTVALLVASGHLARSSGGATIQLEAAAGSPAIWAAARSDRARLLRGLDVRPRVVSGN
jgi:recA bacterial DNA recombination protein